MRVRAAVAHRAGAPLTVAPGDLRITDEQGDTMTSTLTGRTAVITGGARGIGLTLARALAAEGVGVALLDLLDTVDEAAKSIADGFNVPAHGQRVDVTDQAAVADAFNVVRKRLGVPRVLVTVPAGQPPSRGFR